MRRPGIFYPEKSSSRHLGFDDDPVSVYCLAADSSSGGMGSVREMEDWERHLILDAAVEGYGLSPESEKHSMEFSLNFDDSMWCLVFFFRCYVDCCGDLLI